MASRESYANNLFALPVQQVKTWNELSDAQRQHARTLGSGQRGYDGYLYGIRKDGNLTGQREPVPADWDRAIAALDGLAPKVGA